MTYQYQVIANINRKQTFLDVTAPDAESASQLVRERHRRANVEIVSSILLWKGPLRDIRKMNGSNDGKRSLVESIMLPQVIAALKDWLTAVRADAVLIGGVARSYYVKPFYTDDIDFLFASAADVPAAVRGFDRVNAPPDHRYKKASSSFRHHRIGVHVDAFTPADLDVPAAVLAKAFETATRRGVRIRRAGSLRYVKIASPSALVAMKLFGGMMRDEADIIALIESGPVDLTPFPLPRAAPGIRQARKTSDTRRIHQGVEFEMSSLPPHMRKYIDNGRRGRAPDTTWFRDLSAEARRFGLRYRVLVEPELYERMHDVLADAGERARRGIHCGPSYRASVDIVPVKA